MSNFRAAVSKYGSMNHRLSRVRRPEHLFAKTNLSVGSGQVCVCKMLSCSYVMHAVIFTIVFLWEYEVHTKE
jgi:hypothetical protein